MQIVIDIPEEKYIEYKRIGDSRDVLFEAIRKGTQLPKVHGRLIDARYLLNLLKGKCIRKHHILDAPTIIEAYSEE